MRYSLLSRVRGTLIGAAVGEIFGSYWEQRSRFERFPSRLDVELRKNVGAETRLYPWGRTAVLGAQSLIRLGRFDLEDWRYVRQSIESDTILTNQSPLTSRIDHVSTKALLVTLPIALFYHDNEIKLRQNLQQLVEVWQDDSVEAIDELPLLDGALAVGYAIAQSLTEKLNPADLIAQTIAFLGTQTQMALQLAQVQILLEQGAGLERAVTELNRNAQPSNSIALAFYCFLSTLEDLRLSVQRAARTEGQPQIISAITGALSGAYNSTAGIPINWRMVLSEPDAKPMAAWGMATEADMLKLSDSLVAVWSGVYDQAVCPSELTTVAAPRVIRPR